MAKNLIVCSDGTGNSAGKSRTTNVWRVHQAIDVRHGVEQRRYYDDGIGTDGNRWWRRFTGATGFGLSRNIREAYAFLAQHYEPGDRIYLFGFSRGAFTVRALAGMVDASGLMSRQTMEGLRPGERGKALRMLLKNYRRHPDRRRTPVDLERRIARRLGRDVSLHPTVPIRFIGVWDTVGAVGMPVVELRHGIDKLAEWVTGARLYGFHDNDLNDQVQSAAHALALDDERTAFFPEPWHPREGIDQVWFAGVHSSVGGGQPRDALAHVSLGWMLDKADAAGLRLLPHHRDGAKSQADVHGKTYDSRSGLGIFYRPRPRFLRLPRPQLWGDPRESQPHRMDQVRDVHPSVAERIRRGTDGYAPLLPAGLHLEGAPARAIGLSDPAPLWRLERWRRRLYFAFLGFNLAVLGAVLRGTTLQEGSFLAGLGALATDFFSTATELARTHPVPAILAPVAMLVLSRLSQRLKAFREHEARRAWRDEPALGRVP